MDNAQTAAPAGDDAQPVADDHSPLDLDAAVSLFGEAQQREQADASQQPRDASGRFVKPEGAEPNPEDVSADNQPEGDEPPEPTAEEADTPDGEPSEPSPQPEPDGYADNSLKVRLRDGSEVTVADLKKGRERAQELERQLADVDTRVRSEVEKATAQTQQKSQVLDELLPLAVEAVQAQLPPEPDDALWDNDPFEAGRLQRLHDKAKTRLRALQQAQAQRAAEQQEAQAKAFNAYVKEQQTQLLEKRPDLKDTAKAKAFYATLVEAGKALGYSEEEVANVYDHRVILGVVAMHEKARKWDELQAQKPAVADKVKSAAPIQPPTRRATPADRRAADAEVLDKQLRKPGGISLDEATALLNALSR